jgi:hypothetical protein
MKHAADRLEDPPFVSQLKENARNFLAEKFEIFPFHGVAMLLHPKMKSLRGIDADKREGIYQETRKLLKSHEGVSPPSTTQTERSALADEPLKKKKKSADYSDFEDLLPQPENDELSAYLSLPAILESEKDFRILKWWRQHSEQFPTLSKVARFIHSIPASSAPSERTFSTAGFTMNERRTNLEPDSVDDLMFLYSNLILEDAE